MMSPLRVNRKHEVRDSFSKLLTHIFSYDWGLAGDELDRLEDNLTQHMLSRVQDIEQVRERCRIIRLYLRDPNYAQDKKRIVVENVTELLKSASPNQIGKGNPDGNPIKMLKQLYAEIKDDWSEFWRSPMQGAVDSLVDDLDALGQLEPHFKNGDDNIYKQYRQILVSRANCYSLFPLMSTIGPGATPRPEQRKQIIDHFAHLFSAIEKLMAPAGFEYVTEEEKGKLGLAPRVNIVPLAGSET